VYCFVCSAADSLCHTINLKHIDSHTNSLLHQRHVKYKTSGRTTLLGFHTPHSIHTEQEVATTPSPGFPSTSHTSHDPCDMDIDSFDDSPCIGGSFDAEEDSTPQPSKLTKTIIGQ
ncbi:hypothetical protein PAXRUDRAFT_157675, partial [Paxillus rubicundulus Ve08.2h10]